METVGIIAEYNPFHNGHAYHINEAKRLTGSDFCVVVMSGNYVQRGEPAIYDKYLRARCALLNGADLVLELPAPYASSSAEYFARAATDILNKTGITDFLCFGAEDADIDKLNKCAQILNDNLFANKIKSHLAEGKGYPLSFGIAAKESGYEPESEIIKKPNNILAIEYIRALNRSASKIKAVCCQRIGAGFHDGEIKGGIASATAIRKQILGGGTRNIKQAVPENAYGLYLNCKNAHTYNNMSQTLHYVLKTANPDYIKETAGISEGIENRILKSAARNYNITDIISDIKTKRYTFARIQRTILHIILNIKKTDLTNPDCLNYIRVLGFKKNSELISRLNHSALVPVVTNLKHAEKTLPEGARFFLEKEIEYSDIYYATNFIPAQKKYDYRIHPVII